MEKEGGIILFIEASEYSASEHAHLKFFITFHYLLPQKTLRVVVQAEET